MTRAPRAFFALGLAASACTHDVELAPSPPAAAVATTTGPWASMIFVARTDSGVIAIDLGWTNAGHALGEALARIGATPPDVKWVFLTHAHRDHVGAWPDLRQATFVLGRAEVPFFEGSASYRGIIPNVSDRMTSYHRPAPGELKVLPLSSDTSFALGADTVRAYAVPGHTPGSTVYLLRHTLFAGDAANWRWWTGFRGARWEYSDDRGASRQSMASLLRRLDSAHVEWRTLCTAHAKCGLANSALRAGILR